MILEVYDFIFFEKLKKRSHFWDIMPIFKSETGFSLLFLLFFWENTQGLETQLD